MSGTDAPSDPAEAGKQRADPEDMSTEQSTQNDSQRIGEVINGYTQLRPRQVHGNEYRVLSWRNDSVTAHKVDIKRLSCSCEDHEYNTDGQQVCDHVAVALNEAPKRLSVEDTAPYYLSEAVNRANEAANTAQDAAQAVDSALVKAREVDAEMPAEDAMNNAEPSDDELADRETVDPHEAADRLQSAFDDVVEDMQVTVGDGGAIWVQTGKDTPDTLPGPGNVQVFDAFLKNPEQVEYIHDDHAADVDRPGKWWKNRVEPSDVDTYISEVLQ